MKYRFFKICIQSIVAKKNFRPGQNIMELFHVLKIG